MPKRSHGIGQHALGLRRPTLSIAIDQQSPPVGFLDWWAVQQPGHGIVAAQANVVVWTVHTLGRGHVEHMNVSVLLQELAYKQIASSLHRGIAGAVCIQQDINLAPIAADAKLRERPKLIDTLTSWVFAFANPATPAPTAASADG